MTRSASRTVSATYHGEEISVTFTATVHRESDGDANVTNGTRYFESLDLGSIECETVEILGRDYPFRYLPAGLQDAVIELAKELDDWS